VGDSRDFADLVDLGNGRRLFLECRGSGSPTVILESGYGHSGRIWDTDVLPGSWTPPEAPRTTVFDGVSAFTRVCLYDRPGTLLPSAGGFEPSRSDPVSMPRAASDMLDDLHALLTAADVSGPYVLAGHSLGGLLARLFAMRFPDAVAGMVLVDAFSAELWAGFAAALAPEHQAALERLEQEPRKELMTIYPEAEFLDLDAIVAEEIAAMQASPLPPIPAVVLSRGRLLEGAVPPEAVPSDFPWERIEQVSSEAQAKLIPTAQHEIAAESGHVIQLDQPELVIEAIRQVVEAVRNPGSGT
jgi:pimeloyl-ACP methyl ester carboxylesterase